MSVLRLIRKGLPIPFVDGGQDGNHFFHGPKNPQIAAENATLAKSVFEEIRQYVEHTQRDRLEELYDRLVFRLVEKHTLEDGRVVNCPIAVISWAFDFMHVVKAWSDQAGSELVKRMREFAEQLILESADRIPVKVGLLLA
jgi:hypothetical protein